MSEAPLPAAKSPRLMSLDVFRGATIAAMILVNNPGSWGHMFAPLGHAGWHGYTATDLIFPFFLFIVGVAMAFSLSRRQGEVQGKGAVALQIFRRAAVIFALGFALGLWAWYGGLRGERPVRIMGVLQRISLCYLAAALIALFFDTRGRLGWMVGLLLAYWAAMKFIPVPGYGAGNLEFPGNLASWIDHKLLGPFNYSQDKATGLYHDPEGLFSTLPAIATTVMGLLAGTWLRQKERDGNDRAMGLAAAGFVSLVLGLFWSYEFPLNKNLWTSSYVLVCGGWALLSLAFCYYVIDLKGYTRWAKPFHIFGVNAITAFCLASFLGVTTIMIKVGAGEGKTQALKTFLYNNVHQQLIGSWAGPYWASASYGATYVLLFLFLMWLLYRRNIFIKVG